MTRKAVTADISRPFNSCWIDKLKGVLRKVATLLVHDPGEIDAGDKFVFA